MADDLPFVSVVMPVRDEARHVAAALKGILDGDYPAGRMEILVVDGLSADGTRDVVGEVAGGDARVRVLDNAAGTTAAGLNIGLRAARGEVILRMDGHAVPAGDYVRACVAALARTGAWAVGGPMVGRGETPFGRAVARASATPLGAGDARFRLGGEGPTDTVYLGAWRREVFDRVGAFDEGLIRNQDYELSVRIRAAGGMVWLDPAIRSTTVTRGTPLALARQYFGYGRGRATTVARHPHSLRWRQAIPALFVAMVAVATVAEVAIPGAGRWAAGLIGTHLVVTLVAAGAMIRRGGWRDAWWLPPVLWIMHGAWGAGFWVGLAAEFGRWLRRSRGVGGDAGGSGHDGIGQGGLE